jgi:hypothetical protein
MWISFAHRILAEQPSKRREELRAGVPFRGLAFDLAGLHIQSRKSPSAIYKSPFVGSTAMLVGRFKYTD